MQVRAAEPKSTTLKTAWRGTRTRAAATLSGRSAPEQRAREAGIALPLAQIIGRFRWRVTVIDASL